MTHIFKIITLSLAIITGIAPLNAHIFNVQKLTKGDHSIILLSDFHSKHNAKQERELIAHAIKTSGGALVVEDSATPLEHDVTKHMSGDLCQWPLQAANLDQHLAKCPCPTTVFTLYSSAINAGVAASNVEFRFDRDMTLRNFFSMIQKKKEKFAQAITTSAYCNYYESCLQYLKTDIEEPCAALFKKLAMTDMLFEKALEMGILHATESDIAQANKVKAYRNHKLVLSRGIDAIDHLFNDYCNFLLEMEMMLAIESYKNYKTVFVCAGGAHNAHVIKELLKNGYHVACEIGYPMPNIIDPNNYSTMAEKTIDLEQALNTVCKQESKPSVAGMIGTYISSIFSYIFSFFA